MDQKFQNSLKFVLSREGGYSNHPNDTGGETNKGITHKTYDVYRKNNNLPTRSVKYITDKEVADIYYNNYYKASGADKIKDPQLSTVVFDTAVNMGASRAQTILNQSNGDVNKYLDLRLQKYKEFAEAKPSQKVFLKGWNNRVTALKNYINSDTFKTSNNLNNNSTKLNAGIEVNVDKNGQRLFTPEEIGKMSTKEFQANESAIMKQLREKGIPTKAQVESKSKSSNGSSKSDSGSSSSDGRWVTINGNHVLLKD